MDNLEMTFEDIKPSNNYYQVTPDIAMIRDWARTGYDYIQAIFEIFDNSLDAIRVVYEKSLNEFQDGAIRVHWDYDKDLMVICDNGCGMSPKDIPSALIAGSSKKAGAFKVTGVFGVGLKKAAMSLANELEIISRTSKDRKFHSVKFGPDILEANGEWGVHLTKTSKHTLEEMKDYLPESHGTVILLRNLNKEIMPVTDNKKRDVRTFREKISSTLKIGTRHIVHKDSQLDCYLPLSIKVQTVDLDLGSDRTKLFDPLVCENGFNDTKFYVGGPNGQFQHVSAADGSFSCLMRCSHTKAVKNRENSDLGAGITGSYKKAVRWIRSGREICIDRNSTLLETKDLADFYVEIVISDDGISDSSPYRVDSAKKSMTVSAEASDFLHAYLKDFIKASKTKHEEKKVSNTTEEKRDLVSKAMTVSHKTQRNKTSGEKVLDINKNKKDVSEKIKKINKTYIGQSGNKTTIQTEDKFGIKSAFEFVVVEDEYADWAFRESDPDEDNPRATKILLNKCHSWVSYCLRKEENALQLHVVAGGFICAFRDHGDVADRIKAYSEELKSITEAAEKITAEAKKTA